MENAASMSEWNKKEVRGWAIGLHNFVANAPDDEVREFIRTGEAIHVYYALKEAFEKHSPGQIERTDAALALSRELFPSDV
jgi:hypothetical protein